MDFVPRNVAAFQTPVLFEHVRRSVVDWVKEGFAALPGGARANNAALTPAYHPWHSGGWPTGTAVWESRRTQWAYESGSGAGLFSVTTGGSPSTGARVCPDYGRVILPSAVPTGTAVLCQRAERAVHGYLASEPWVAQLDSLSLWTGGDARPTGKGDLAVLAEHRAQLPCVVVQEAGGVRSTPYELGGPAHEFWVDLALHCLAETPSDRTWLHDAMAVQAGTVLPTFDAGVEGPPTDADGALLPGAKSFFGRCDSTPWRPLTVQSARSGEFGRSGDLFWATVVWTLHVGTP